MTQITARITIRKDSNANWTSSNPVLSLGELAATTDVLYSGTDQMKVKVGDGVQTWTNLDYLPMGVAGVQTVTGDGVDNTDPLNPVMVLSAYELNANKSIDVITDQASNTKYPSVKAVFDWVSSLTKTLAQTLTVGNKTGQQTIESNDGKSILSILNTFFQSVFTNGTYISKSRLDNTQNTQSFTDGVTGGLVEITAAKTSYNHAVSNEFNSPDNNFNGRVTVVSGADNNAIVLAGSDTLNKVVVYNSSDNAGLVSVRNDVDSETILLNGFTGNVTAAKHITTGGTSGQFVKGDGTLDSNTYAIATTDYTQQFTYAGSPFTLTVAPDYIYIVRVGALILDEADSLDMTIAGTTFTVTHPSLEIGDKVFIKYKKAN